MAYTPCNTTSLGASFYTFDFRPNLLFKKQFHVFIRFLTMHSIASIIKSRYYHCLSNRHTTKIGRKMTNKYIISFLNHQSSMNFKFKQGDTFCTTNIAKIKIDDNIKIDGIWSNQNAHILLGGIQNISITIGNVWQLLIK